MLGNGNNPDLIFDQNKTVDVEFNVFSRIQMNNKCNDALH